MAEQEYTKGQFDRGELADKFVVIVIFDTVMEASEFEKIHGAENTSLHQVFASGYDIDYDQHKITMSPVYVYQTYQRQETTNDN